MSAGLAAHLALGISALLAFGGVLALLRVRAEMRLQSRNIQALLEARIPALVAQAVQRELANRDGPTNPDAKGVGPELHPLRAEWQEQLDAELHQMRRALVQPPVSPPSAPPVAPTQRARRTDARPMPVARAQVPVDPPPIERELSDAEIDALPAELPSPTRARRLLPTPKKPPLRPL